MLVACGAAPPFVVRAHLARAGPLRLLGFEDEAHDHLLLAVAADPRGRSCATLLARLLVSTREGRRTGSEPIVILDLCDLLRDTAGVYAPTEAFVSRCAGETGSLALRADRDDSDLAEAVDAAIGAVSEICGSASPHLARLLAVRAMLFADTGHAAAALDCASRAVALARSGQTDDVERLAAALACAAYVDVALRRDADAVRRLEEIVGLEERSASGALQGGRPTRFAADLFAGAGQVAHAVHLFRVDLMRNPTPEVALRLSDLLREQGRLDEARWASEYLVERRACLLVERARMRLRQLSDGPSFPWPGSARVVYDRPAFPLKTEE
jgi:hypothetical protein